MLLRLTVPRAVAPFLLERLVASFCQAYSEVEGEIAAGAEVIDLAAQGFDAGIRLGQFIVADMVAVRLTPAFPLVVVGSPEYLRRRRQPERIDDLRQHACLRMRRSNGSIAPWSFVSGNQPVEAMVSGPLIANDLPTILVPFNVRRLRAQIGVRLSRAWRPGGQAAWFTPVDAPLFGGGDSPRNAAQPPALGPARQASVDEGHVNGDSLGWRLGRGAGLCLWRRRAAFAEAAAGDAFRRARAT